jgi:hypothetical protein
MATEEAKLPTKQHLRQAVLVEAEVRDLLASLSAQGIEPALLIAGMGSALSHLIGHCYGEKAIMAWFVNQAVLLSGDPERSN